MTTLHDSVVGALLDSWLVGAGYGLCRRRQELSLSLSPLFLSIYIYLSIFEILIINNKHLHDGVVGGLDGRLSQARDTTTHNNQECLPLFLSFYIYTSKSRSTHE